MSEKEPVVQGAAEPQDSSDDLTNHNLEGLAKKNRELLDEKKKIQARLAEFEKQKEDEARKRLEEDGKLKEALTAANSEIAKLRDYENKIKKQEEFYNVQLEEELKDLPDTLKKLVTGFQGEAWEKVKLATELKKENKPKPGIGVERPGTTGTPQLDLSKYQGKDRTEKLLDLKYSNPDEYKLVMEAIKKEAK